MLRRLHGCPPMVESLGRQRVCPMRDPRPGQTGTWVAVPGGRQVERQPTRPARTERQRSFVDKSSAVLQSAAAGAIPGRSGFDTLVVGAGFAGSVLAERLASQLGQRVL